MASETTKPLNLPLSSQSKLKQTCTERVGTTHYHWRPEDTANDVEMESADDDNVQQSALPFKPQPNNPNSTTTMASETTKSLNLPLNSQLEFNHTRTEHVDITHCRWCPEDTANDIYH
jgi:hypothetical protein